VVENVASALEDGVVPALIYNNEDVHRAEIDRIFNRAWVFIGHESEVPHPGDYCLRYIANDPFIFVRDEKGKLHVFFDACRHRGTQLCRADIGNASHFRCPYHGWIYRNDGRLAGIPAMGSAYKGLDRTRWGLVEVPQLASIHGLVFVSLDPDAPTFDDYLGDMRWYLDLVFGLGKLTVIGEPQVWEMGANWKLGAENFSGDDYHTITLHRSMYDIGVIPVPPTVNMFGHHVWAHSDHGFHSVSFGLDHEPDSQLWWGLPPEVVAAIDKTRLSPEQLELARQCRTTVGTVFPNLSFIFVNQSVDPERKPPATMLGVRQWRPTASDSIELWSWILSWEDAPEDFVRDSYECHMATFGTSGIFEQDDTEPWTTITRTSGSAFARLSDFRLNYQMGTPGVGTAERMPDWPGPGTAFNTRYEEGNMRNLVETWVRYMRRPNGVGA
jgi:phenylpropionate dioxygenase-like ring-hydroxylating dioxygenase large terminal subunit